MPLQWHNLILSFCFSALCTFLLPVLLFPSDSHPPALLVSLCWWSRSSNVFNIMLFIKYSFPPSFWSSASHPWTSIGHTWHPLICGLTSFPGDLVHVMAGEPGLQGSYNYWPGVPPWKSCLPSLYFKTYMSLLL